MEFGQRLKELREARGLTQTDLGRGLGKDGADASKQSIRDWEKGDHYPKVDQLALLCQKLGCSADFLVFGAERAASPQAAELAAEFDKIPSQQDRDRAFLLCRGAIQLARGVSGQADQPAPHAQRKAG